MGSLVSSVGTTARHVRKNSRRIIKRFSLKGSTLSGDLPNVENLRYQPDRLDILCKSTPFSKKEIQLLYRGFKEVSPSGVVTESQFRDLFFGWFPNGECSNYPNYVFQTFDQNKDGLISFKEFLFGLAVLSRGSIEEKLKWIFTLYDVNGDGRLTYGDLLKVVSSIYNIVGNHANPRYDELTIREHTTEMFQKFDKTGCGEVSIEDFLRSCSRNSTLVNSMRSFDTVFYLDKELFIATTSDEFYI